MDVSLEKEEGGREAGKKEHKQRAKAKRRRIESLILHWDYQDKAGRLEKGRSQPKSFA